MLFMQTCQTSLAFVSGTLIIENGSLHYGLPPFHLYYNLTNNPNHKT